MSRRQAILGGMTRSEWAWRLERGWWQRPLPGVVVTHTGEVTPEEKTWAAWACVGQGAVVAGDAALAQHGFSFRDLRVHDVAIPLNRRVVSRQFRDGTALTIRRNTELDGSTAIRPGVPVMEPNAALLYAAAWAPTDRAAEWRLASAVQQRLVRPLSVRETLGRLGDVERRELILAVLRDVELGAHALSELDFLRFCREHGVPEPDELQVRVRAGGNRYLDGRYRRQRVTVEIDGAHHSEVAQWEADALRGLQLAAVQQGEQVLRITRSMMRHDGQEVAELLRRILC